MWRTKFLIVAFIGLLGVAAVGVSVTTSFQPGDNYPARPITVVVPFPAGGPSDVVARVVTEQMGTTLGQSLVIENVGGGGGTIGSARVAAAHPDGYTLLGQHGIARVSACACP
jgi:tripartite-type tricarboxylate transporter receptor subunit TctC